MIALLIPAIEKSSCHREAFGWGLLRWAGLFITGSFAGRRSPPRRTLQVPTPSWAAVNRGKTLIAIQVSVVLLRHLRGITLPASFSHTPVESYLIKGRFSPERRPSSSRNRCTPIHFKAQTILPLLSPRAVLDGTCPVRFTEPNEIRVVLEPRSRRTISVASSSMFVT